jgi:PAS domain S-box-containing protein
MTRAETPQEKFHKLRQQAEILLAEQSDVSLPERREDIPAILHELEVQQIELQLQNEELRQAQQELEQTKDSYFNLYELAPIAYFTLNAKGMIISANLNAVRMLQLERRLLLQCGISRFIAQEDRNAFSQMLTRARNCNDKQTGEFKLLNVEHVPFFVHVEIAAQQDEESGEKQFQVAFLDITEKKQAEMGLQKAHGELEQRVLERTSDLERTMNEQRSCSSRAKKNSARLPILPMTGNTG